MTLVYGPGVEPGGMELDNEHRTVPCPKCGQPAHHWFCERAEGGSINIYGGTSCAACGFEIGNWSDGEP